MKIRILGENSFFIKAKYKLFRKPENICANGLDILRYCYL